MASGNYGTLSVQVLYKTRFSWLLFIMLWSRSQWATQRGRGKWKILKILAEGTVTTEAGSVFQNLTTKNIPKFGGNGWDLAASHNSGLLSQGVWKEENTCSGAHPLGSWIFWMRRSGQTKRHTRECRPSKLKLRWRYKKTIYLILAPLINPRLFEFWRIVWESHFQRLPNMLCVNATNHLREGLFCKLAHFNFETKIKYGKQNKQFRMV